jgi:hypothetical protein
MKTIMMQFLDELKKDGYNIPLEHYNSMLEIEKEQIIDAYENGVGDENERNLSGQFTNAEEYYNQTYNQNK